MKALTLKDLNAFADSMRGRVPNIDTLPIHMMDMGDLEKLAEDDCCNLATRIELDRFDDETGDVLSLLRSGVRADGGAP